MVARQTVFTVLVITIILLSCSGNFVGAQDRVYYFGYEYAKLWINHDRTVDLLYDRSLTLSSGREINWIEIGQPTGDFTIGEARDQYGNVLSAEDTSSGGNYKVRVTLNTPLQAGETINFTLITNVAGMLHEDTTNPGNVGMQFAPAWDIQTTIRQIRIEIVLPPDVAQEMVKTGYIFWDNVLTDQETGNLAVYWETQNLAPNEQYIVGVSFPSQYVQAVTPGPTVQPIEFDPAFLIGIAAALFFVILVVALIILSVRKRPYTKPVVSMETLGIRRGLTAVEASYLLDLKPTQIVTEILYSLLQKRVVWVESSKPVLKLKIMPEFEDKRGSEQNPLRYYEIDFLHSLKSDGTLDEEKLAKTVMTVRETLEEKLRGYSRKETVDYYRKIVDKAWNQVEQTGTAEVASKAYDEQLLWLFLDPNYGTRTERAFQTRTFQPSPLWLWYWYGYTYYHPHPTYKPTIGVPATPTTVTKAPSIPGADFANNIATSLEKTSNNIVANLEKFANSILPPPPPPPKASHEPAQHGAKCVCACHACACACACVSCACACAGGGVG